MPSSRGCAYNLWHENLHFWNLNCFLSCVFDLTTNKETVISLFQYLYIYLLLLLYVQILSILLLDFVIFTHSSCRSLHVHEMFKIYTQRFSNNDRVRVLWGSFPKLWLVFLEVVHGIFLHKHALGHCLVVEANALTFEGDVNNRQFSIFRHIY